MPTFTRSAVVSLALALLAFGWDAAPCAAQYPADALAVLPAQDNTAPPRQMLRTYLLDQANLLFAARLRDIAALKTPDDIDKRRRSLRARFIDAVGGLPERSPLNPVVVGTIACDGYRIEKLIYESRPGHHVTANFYLPAGQGPFPGVLLPCGHTDNGKAGYQFPAILLARNGIACLCYDPPEQGERAQLLDDGGKPLISRGTTAHSLMGTPALLLGQALAQYWIWDAMRGVDYLVSRPEIDPKRIGCTGSSGGGMMTAYLMALDDRVFVAAPSCYLTSLDRLFATIGPQDAEQNIPGQIAFGMNHGDYLLMHAPRPAIMLCATRDFFDIDGSWATFREAKRLYGIEGFAERLNIAEFDTTHGFPKPQREQMVRFMRHWLMGKDDPIVEPPTVELKDDLLRCTQSGQVESELKGKTIPDFFAELHAQLSVRRADLAKSRDRDALAIAVRRLIALPERIAPAKMRDLAPIDSNGRHIQRLVFETAPGIVVPALRFDPPGDGKSPLAIVVDGAGKSAVARPGGQVDAILKSGRSVLAIDLRGWGETAPGGGHAAKPDYLGADFTEAYMSIDIARPLLGQRVFDLLAVIAAIAPREKEGIELIGIGAAGPTALHAAFLDPRITQLTLDHSLASWSMVARSKLSVNQLTNTVPGALKEYDLPDLAAGLVPRPLTIVEPQNAMAAPIDQSAIEREFAPVMAKYQQQNASDKLTIRQTKASK